MTPICKGRDGSARPSSFSFSSDLVSGVHVREQRQAKPLDARNEGTRAVICVSRAFCSIEPSVVYENGEKIGEQSERGESLGREFFLPFHPAFRFFPIAKPGPQANAYLAFKAGV